MRELPGFSVMAQGRAGRQRLLLGVFLGSTLIWLGVDQVGKAWAFAPGRVHAGAVDVIPGLSAGLPARNYGGMYTLEGHRPPFLQGVLAVVGFVVLGMVLRWVFVLDRDRWTLFDAAAGGMLLAGAVGNQVDRLALGYVRDYLILARWPTDVFNSADLFMVIGAVFLLGSLLIWHRFTDKTVHV